MYSVRQTANPTLVACPWSPLDCFKPPECTIQCKDYVKSINIQTLLGENVQKRRPYPYPAQSMCAKTLFRSAIFAPCVLCSSRERSCGFWRRSLARARVRPFFLTRNLELGGSCALRPSPWGEQFAEYAAERMRFVGQLFHPH